MITKEFLNQSLKRGMKKSAQMSGSAKSSLIGAGMGAGLGGLAWLLRPKDRDQNQWREALISILGGAALGGAGGLGFHHLTNNNPWDATKAVSKKTKDIVTDIVNPKDDNKNNDRDDTPSVEVKPETENTEKGKVDSSKNTVEPGSSLDKRLAQTSLVASRRNKYKEEYGSGPEALKEQRLAKRRVSGTKFFGKRFVEDGPFVYYPNKDEEITDDDLRLISDRPGGKNRVFGFAELMSALTDGKNKQWLSNAASAANKSGDVVKPMYVEWNPDGTIVITGINSKGQYGASKYTPPVSTVRLPSMPQKAKDVLRKLQGLQ